MTPGCEELGCGLRPPAPDAANDKREYHRVSLRLPALTPSRWDAAWHKPL
jgi:hypothetical protein